MIPTREFCHVCGHLSRISFYVKDEIWKQLHPSLRNEILCLNCFTERADEKMLRWEDGIKFYPCSMASQIEIQERVWLLNQPKENSPAKQSNPDNQP